jgi:hypothetical protein
MRRTALVLAACVLLAGCVVPFGGSGSGGPGAETPAGASGGGDTGAAPGSGTTTGSGTATPTPTVDHETRPDPETDRIGWENGYWHDDPVPVEAADGLNDSEREAVLARAMARVEVVREAEFEEPVNVSVVSRANYSAEFGGGTTGAALRTFDNAKFEALYLIGTDEDSIETQQGNRNRTVAGFYSPARGSIVVVSDSETPTLDGERTLAHELVHALQDQRFGLDDTGVPRTRDAYNARNGLVEGDARSVELSYMDRCGERWSCLPRADGGDGDGGDGSSIHLGVYVLSYFPYSDGVGFVSHLRGEGGWDAVDDAFDDPPTSATAVIEPERYGRFEPQAVELESRGGDGWERVRPDGRPDYAVLGQSALTAMFAYTLYDEYNQSAAVDPAAFLNTDGVGVNRTDPFDYGLDPASGWAGDRMHVYERDGETASVWRLAWESPAEAEQFADGYRALLAHWGGDRVAEGIWVVPGESPFDGAVSIAVDGDTVTVVRAPGREALDDLRPAGAAGGASASVDAAVDAG